MLRTSLLALAALSCLIWTMPARAEAARAPMRIAVVPAIPAVAGGLRLPATASVDAADELSRALSQVHGVVVSSPTGVYHAVTSEGGNGGSTPLAVAKAARRVQANIAVVVEGVVDGKDVRLMATFLAPEGQSARVPPGVMRKGTISLVTDFFNLQNDFVTAVLETLGVKPDAAEQARIAAAMRPTASLNAWSHYILARRQLPLASLEAFQDAVRELKMAVKADPSFALAEAELAESAALLSMQQALTGLRDASLITLSVGAAEALANVQPDLPEYHRARALAYALVSDRRASKEAETALNLHPDDPEATLWLGLAAGDGGRPSIQKALELDPALPLGHLFLAVLALQENNLKLMQTECEKATAACPTDPSPLLLMATLQTSQGETDKALATYQQILDINDKAAFAYAARARLLYRKEKMDDARRAMKQALDLDPSMARLVLEQATVAQQAQKWDDAEKEYRLVLLANDKDADAWRGLGTLALGRNKPVDAEGFFKRALETNPADPWSWIGLYNTYNRQGRAEVAEQLLRAAKEKCPNDPYVNLYLGQAEENHGSYKPALDLYKVALEQSPLLTDAAFGLASATQHLDPAAAQKAWQDYLALVEQVGAAKSPTEQEHLRTARKYLANP